MDEKTIQKSLARFATIRVGAARQYPFLGQGIYSMVPRPVPGLAQKCGGWAMDQYGRVYFDPEMILGLGEEAWPLKTLIADFIHEVWHWTRRHPERYAALSIGVGKEKDSLRWNIAADAEINGADAFLREHLQDFCVFPEKLQDSLGRSLPPNKTAEQYYKMLEPEEKEEEEEGPEREGPEPGGEPGEDDSKEGDSPGKQSPKPGGGGRTIPGEGGKGDEPSQCMGDSPRDWEDGPPTEEKPGISEKQGETTRKQMAREIQESARTRGTVSVDWAAWAEEELSPPKIAWQEKIRRFARHSMEVSVGASDFTFRRRSRRQHAVGGSVIIPAVFHPKLRIGVVVDSSGSMSTEDLRRCVSEVEGIAKAAGGSCFVVTGDTDVGWEGRTSSGRGVSFNRRGGTDMRPLIARVEKEQPKVHCTVVLTDGYTPWPDQGKTPVMAGLIGNHCGESSVPRWIESILIDGDE